LDAAFTSAPRPRFFEQNPDSGAFENNIVNPTTELSPYFIEPVRTPVGARGFLGEQFAPDSSLSPRDYWLIVRKHLRLVLAVVIGAITLTGVALMLMRPLYTSQALLLIERNAPQVLDIRQALPEPMMADDYDYYKTQYELLKSRTLAAHVIRDQALEADLSAQIASQGRLLQTPQRWRCRPRRSARDQLRRAPRRLGTGHARQRRRGPGAAGGRLSETARYRTPDRDPAGGGRLYRIRSATGRGGRQRARAGLHPPGVGDAQ
jgi:hypothetical protein